MYVLFERLRKHMSRQLPLGLVSTTCLESECKRGSSIERELLDWRWLVGRLLVSLSLLISLSSPRATYSDFFMELSELDLPPPKR